MNNCSGKDIDLEIVLTFHLQINVNANFLHVSMFRHAEPKDETKKPASFKAITRKKFPFCFTSHGMFLRGFETYKTVIGTTGEDVFIKV